MCWILFACLHIGMIISRMFVRWQNVSSEPFRIFNGVRQGGLLSPYLFRFYIRKLIGRITKLNIGCCCSSTVINLLAYADDIVLLSPSWHGLQYILNVIEISANEISMSFNTKKTVCVVFTVRLCEAYTHGIAVEILSVCLSVRPSVRPSVCPSVKRVYCDKT